MESLTVNAYNAIQKVIEKTTEFVRSFSPGWNWSIKYENMVFSYGLSKTIRKAIKELNLNAEEKETVLQYMKEYYSYSLM